MRAAAADGVWINATANSTWSTSANWLNGQVADGADAVAAFNTLDLTANRTVNLGASRVIGALVFGDTAPSSNWTVASGTGGPFSLTLSSSSGKPTITVENQTTVISAVLDGTQGFTKSGAGTLTLTGANTISGGIVLTQGVLGFASGALAGNTLEFAANATLTWSGVNLQDISSQVLIDDGVTATFSLGANDVTLANPLQLGLLGTAAVTKAGTGALTLSAANGFLGAFKANAGRVILSGGPDRLAPTVPVTIGQGANSAVLQLGDAYTPVDQTMASLITTGTGTANAVVGGNVANSTLTVNNATAGAFAGRLGGAGLNEDHLALVKSGAGPWTLSGASTFTGDVQIRGGALIVANAAALGSGAKTVTISGTTNAPSLQLNQPSGLALPAELRLVTSNDLSATPALLSSAGQNSISGPILLTSGGFGAGQTRISVTGGTLALTGPISPAEDAATARTLILDGTASGSVEGLLTNGNVTLALTKAGAGTWTLNALNTYTGATTINAGKLVVSSIAANGAPQPLGAATSAILIGSTNTSGTLEYAGASDATLARNVTVNGSGGAILQNSGGAVLSLAGTLNRGARPLTFSGGNFKVTGRITGAASSTPLTISGARVSLWNTTNNYGGPTIVSGGGRLTLGAIETLPDGTDLTLGSAVDDSDGWLDLHGASETIGGLNSAGRGQAVITNEAAVGTATLRLTGSGSFAGLIRDGSSAFTAITVSSAGTQVLAGDGTYTGETTVAAGTLLLSGSLSGTTTVRLAGGTLALGARDLLNDHAALILQGGALSLGGFSEGSAEQPGLASLWQFSDGLIDFGLGAGVVLSFAEVGQHLGGKLTFINWSGAPGVLGAPGDDRLIFGGDPSSFASAYAQEDVSFDGLPGYNLISLAPGRFEVTAAAAVPEPQGSTLLALASGVLLQSRWRRRVRGRA